MREIKFRAWLNTQDEDEPDYKMVYDLAFEEYEPINDLLKSVKHLMQYTGLKDKNGKEIYEGDIVLAWEYELKKDFTKGNRKCGIGEYEVYWSSFLAGYGLRNNHETDIPLVHKDDYEIIGNIYENPELLESK